MSDTADTPEGLAMVNEFSSRSVVSVARAARMLGYSSRSTVYARIRSGHLAAVADDAGRLQVLKTSVEEYLANPPSGSWSRTPAELGTGANPAVAAEEVAALRSENMQLREVVSRLQMVREMEGNARKAEAAAQRHLTRALRQRGKALGLAASATEELNELITTLLPPNTILDAGSTRARVE